MMSGSAGSWESDTYDEGYRDQGYGFLYSRPMIQD